MGIEQYFNDPTYGFQTYLGPNTTFSQGDDGRYNIMRDGADQALRGSAYGDLMSGYRPAEQYEQDLRAQGQQVFTSGLDRYSAGATQYNKPDARSFVESVQGPGAWSTDRFGNTVFAPQSGVLKDYPYIKTEDDGIMGFLKSPVAALMLLGAGGASGLFGNLAAGGAAGVGSEVLATGIGAPALTDTLAGLAPGITQVGETLAGVGGLSPETVAFLEAAGYAPETIAQLGTQFGASTGNLLGSAAGLLEGADYASGLDAMNLRPAGSELGLSSLASTAAAGLAAATPATQFGPLDALRSLFNLGGPGGGNSAGGNWTSYIPGALSLASGITGLSQADRLRKLGANSVAAADPFGQSGARALADTQLQQLMRDPIQVSATDPSYKLRQQAARRSTATMGEKSGAMAVAAANASTDWYNQRLAQLGQLAGAGFNPAGGVGANINAETAASSLLSQALASIGFGTNQLIGNNKTGMNNPALMAALLQSAGGGGA